MAELVRFSACIIAEKATILDCVVVGMNITREIIKKGLIYDKIMFWYTSASYGGGVKGFSGSRDILFLKLGFRE